MKSVDLRRCWCSIKLAITPG